MNPIQTTAFVVAHVPLPSFGTWTLCRESNVGHSGAGTTKSTLLLSFS